MNALGRISRTARMASGHMFLGSRGPKCRPPTGKGWHGGPPERRSTPSSLWKSNSPVSYCSICQCRTCAILGLLFSRNVAIESLSHSTMMSCMNPARTFPSANPLHPANNSTLRIEKLANSPFQPCLPARCLQFGRDNGVAPNVALKFRMPKSRSGFFGEPSRGAVLPMPEASMQEDCAPAPYKRDVRVARHVAPGFSVTVAKPPCDASQFKLGLRVAGPDPAHSRAAFQWRERAHRPAFARASLRRAAGDHR
jgi:hypothetical protein